MVSLMATSNWIALLRSIVVSPKLHLYAKPELCASIEARSMLSLAMERWASFPHRRLSSRSLILYSDRLAPIHTLRFTQNCKKTLLCLFRLGWAAWTFDFRARNLFSESGLPPDVRVAVCRYFGRWWSSSLVVGA